mgnify:CR=1 FL=1
MYTLQKMLISHRHRRSAAPNIMASRRSDPSDDDASIVIIIGGAGDGETLGEADFHDSSSSSSPSPFRFICFPDFNGSGGGGRAFTSAESMAMALIRSTISCSCVATACCCSMSHSHMSLVSCDSMRASCCALACSRSAAAPRPLRRGRDVVPTTDSLVLDQQVNIPVMSPMALRRFAYMTWCSPTPPPWKEEGSETIWH